MLPRVREDAPTREEIAELLDLAVRAPNHHRTEPWRFIVLGGAERERLARAMRDEAVASGTDEDRALHDARAKVDRAPIIVVFTYVPSDDPKVIEQEELVATAMAMQNFLVAAYAKGLGAMLRTGPAAYHPAIAEHLELAPNERVVGLVYLGYPAAEREPTARESAETRTRWFGVP